MLYKGRGCAIQTSVETTIDREIPKKYARIETTMQPIDIACV